VTVSSQQVATLDPAPEVTRQIVHVFPSADKLDLRLKEALAHLAPVQFVSCANLSECGHGESVIVFSGDDKVIADMLRANVRSFHFPSGVPGVASADTGQRVQFGDSAHLDARLRGRCLLHKAMPDRFALNVEPGDEVLASHAGKPDWVLRKRHEAVAYLVSMPLPIMQPGDLPAWFLSGENFMLLLPLVHFLRELTADSRWEKPPMMACLVIDDPNLHWSSYGFIGFESLLARTETANAHVAFATIPLDAWGFHSKTARLFQEHQKRFSLLYHGNDHTKWELAEDRTLESWLGAFSQGMTRIARLEEKTGLSVARVMVPPHEGYSDAALLALSTLGFEGVCVPLGLIKRWNARLQVQAAFALEMTEWMGGPLPVLQRFNITREDCQNQIIIAAFLGRPIIPVAHHDTFADGYAAVERTFATINSLGDVRWVGPSEMLNQSYLKMRENGNLWVKLYSRRIQVTVPEGVTKLGVIFSQDSGPSVTLDFTVRDAEGEELRQVRQANGEAVEVRPGQKVDVQLVNPDAVDYRQIKKPGLSYHALARRILCEGRDRLSPFLAKLGGQKSK
jgi:hypothetical protein